MISIPRQSIALLNKRLPEMHYGSQCRGTSKSTDVPTVKVANAAGHPLKYETHTPSVDFQPLTSVICSMDEEGLEDTSVAMGASDLFVSVS